MQELVSAVGSGHAATGRADLPAAAGRRRPSKTALVLGGGGFTGGVYQIGALRALDLLATGHNVNQFDVYVGTSAGSFIASLAANGYTPEQMMQAVDSGSAGLSRDGNFGMMLRPNYRELLTRGARVPLHLAGSLRTLARVPASFSSLGLAVAAAEALPSGMYTGEGIEEYLHDVLSDSGRADDFRDLGAELYIAATDIDTCERVVLGGDGWDDVPISTAVRASAAMPMLYKPVEVKGRTLVDGGISSSTNLELAAEAGAKLIIAVNPLVPFINRSRGDVDSPPGSERTHRVADMGFPKIGYQTFKLQAYRTLHDLVDQWEDRYPGVDLVLIEPELDDQLMFETNVMDYSARFDVARHGFRSVTMKLAEDYDHLHEVSRRHGLDISATRIRKVVEHFTAEPERDRAWRRILGQTTRTLLRQSASD